MEDTRKIKEIYEKWAEENQEYFIRKAKKEDRARKKEAKRMRSGNE